MFYFALKYNLYQIHMLENSSSSGALKWISVELFLPQFAWEQQMKTLKTEKRNVSVRALLKYVTDSRQVDWRLNVFVLWKNRRFLNEKKENKQTNGHNDREWACVCVWTFHLPFDLLPGVWLTVNIFCACHMFLHFFWVKLTCFVTKRQKTNGHQRFLSPLFVRAFRCDCWDFSDNP